MKLRATILCFGTLFAGAASASGCNCEPEASRPEKPPPSPVATSGLALSPPPRMAVVRTKQPPVLDGRLSESAWSLAETTDPFVETRLGGPAAVDASAKLLWDARFLYLAVEVRDTLLQASDTEHDARLWERDCVELMFDPDGDAIDYFEIQVSPRGVVFDTRYDSRREPRPFGHLDWDSGARVGVFARGEIDDEKRDDGYTVEIAIPWQAFSHAGKRTSAPEAGHRWGANFYVMDLGPDRQRAASWSPLGVGDFHVPRRFGVLVFEGVAAGMSSTSEPLRIPSGRMPSSMDRGGAPTRGSAATVVRERASDPRKPAKPPRSSIRSDAQRLESEELAH